MHVSFHSTKHIYFIKKTKESDTGWVILTDVGIPVQTLCLTSSYNLDMLASNVQDEGYSRNASCVLN